MSLSSTIHLNFRGDARQALAYYHSVFGGQIMVATYAQVGVPTDPATGIGGPAAFGPVAADSPDADHVAFGVVMGDNGFRIAGYDVIGAAGGGIAGSAPSTTRRAQSLTHDESVFVLLNGASYDELSGPWKSLSESGTVIAELTTDDGSGPSYGMLTDRFGVTWIFGVTPQ